MFVAMSQKYVKIFGPAQIIYSALTFSQAGPKLKEKPTSEPGLGFRLRHN